MDSGIEGACSVRVVGVAGGGESYGSGLEVVVRWEIGDASFGEFGDEPVSEFDCGEKGFGHGALDASFGKGMDDNVDRGKDRRLVEQGRESEGLHFRGLFLCGFCSALLVVMAAESRAVDCG